MRKVGLKTPADWMDKHGLVYYNNKKAWQNMGTFTDFMEKTAEHISQIHGNTGIAVMIIDNATSHTCSMVELGSFKGF